MEDPGVENGLLYSGWTLPYWSDDINRFKLGELLDSDALLLGRVTYQAYSNVWPFRSNEDGIADRMNSLHKYVVSTTLQKLTWNNSHLIQKYIKEKIMVLKGQDGGDILVTGSGKLVSYLMQEDLIDEYRLLVYPVVLGIGKRLFNKSMNCNLKLAETRHFSSGVVLTRYERENYDQPVPLVGRLNQYRYTQARTTVQQ
jgi:dihydrofolate reductase